MLQSCFGRLESQRWGGSLSEDQERSAARGHEGQQEGYVEEPGLGTFWHRDCMACESKPLVGPAQVGPQDPPLKDLESVRLISRQASTLNVFARVVRPQN